MFNQLKRWRDYTFRRFFYKVAKTMIFSDYTKVGVYKDGKLTWYAPNMTNIVYGIAFPDGGVYIGSTKDLRKRFYSYISAFRHNHYPSKLMQEAFNNNLKFEIYVVKSDLENEVLVSEEYRFIQVFKPCLNTAMNTIQGKGGIITNMKDRVNDILSLVMWKELSRGYFDKSASWFYHKMDGIDGNGGVGGFTPNETEQMRNALYDIANRIKVVADNI